MKNVRAVIAGYAPKCEQEARDRAQMLAFMDANDGWLTRENAMAHVTASAWLVDPARTRVLMVYHNIYRSWSWVGGHADGESDLLGVALREAGEETGVQARAVLDGPISIESLCVNGHVKRGCYVAAHIHMNVTYLLEADPDAVTRIKPDENSGVMWIDFGEVDGRTSEECMRPIYEKLIRRAAQAQ